MKLDHSSIGFAVLLALFAVCSTAFANEHQIALSKLMKVQNCSFDLSSYNVTNINVQRLHAQHLEALRNVNHITQSAMDRLVVTNRGLRILVQNFTSGLRFGADCACASLTEDLQLGTGHLNYRQSIQSTGEVLARFGHALNELAEKWRAAAVEASQSPFAGRLAYRDRKQNVPLSRNLNQITRAALNRLVLTDLALSPAFHQIAASLLGDYQFDTTAHGNGDFNRGETAFESAKKMKAIADSLSVIAKMWKIQLGQQKGECERYLGVTFAQVAHPVVDTNA